MIFHQLLLFAIGLSIIVPGHAQEYFTNFQTYSSREGFHAFKFSGDIVKDKKGFVWIGSDNGLYRFDGQNFKVFHHDPNDSFSLPSDNASTPFIERDGDFWINNGNTGICRFDSRTEKFKSWKNSNNQDFDISKYGVQSFFQDSKLRLWIVIAGKGLARLNKADNTLKIFSFYDDTMYARKWKSTAWLGNIAEDKNHFLWIATHDGLICFDPDKENYILYKDTNHQKENQTLHVFINHVYIDRNNMIWAGTWGAGLKKFDPQKKKWETYKWNLKYSNNSTRNIVHAMCAKSENELWIASEDTSILIFNILTKKFMTVVNLDVNASNIPRARNFFEDSVGYLWCSGMETLIKINTNNSVFHFQPVPDNSKYGTGRLACNAFIKHPDDSLLYIGTYYSKGIYTLNKQTGVIKNYPNKKNKTLENINQFLLDREKNFWICSNNGVYLFNVKTKQYQSLPFSVKNNMLLQSNVSSELEDDDGSIWFASRENGLLHYDKKKKEIFPFQPEKNKMPDEFIMSLFMDSRGNIWAGYHGHAGIVCIKKNRKEIVFYNNATYKIPGYDVSSISESKEGNIFFSLHVSGLGVIKNPLSGKDSFLLYTNQNGLTGNAVFSTVKDKHDNLWISTNDGISVCRTSDMFFRNFTVTDGLRDTFSDGDLSCDDKGNIYLGYNNGFQFFQPELVDRPNQPPPIIMHSFKINGKEYKGDINSVNNLFLNYDQANFTFEYAALTFTNNDHIQYAYQLKGYDKSWLLAGSQRYAAYSIPHGGRYVLQIKAANAAGQWNENPYQLTIHVKPPVWETWWFRILSLVIIGLAVYWFTKRRIKMIRKGEERKTYIHKIKAEAEMKALRAQMNPHFIFNCMNTIDAYMHKNNTEIASAFLHKFSKLIRLVLENSQHPFISIQKDLEALQLYIELEEERNDYRFSHEIYLPESLAKTGYKIPPLLIQPYVENAILHGLRHKVNGKGLLKISFEEQETFIECKVEDNGIGRENSAQLYSTRKKENISLGLKVSSERIESLNDLQKGSAAVEISDKKEGSGTIVKLRLPKFDETM